MKILFVGLGNLGAQVFDLIVLRSRPGDHLLVAGKNLMYLRERVQWTAAAALQLGISLKIESIFLDILNKDQVAATISSFNPDVIFCSVSLLPSARISQLPPPLFTPLAKAGGGPWLPTTLALVYKLMQAIQETGLKPIVINGGTPDNSHEILTKVGLAPTSGFGNIGLVIPALKQAIAEQLRKPLERIEVLFFAHAYVVQHLRRGTTGGAPFYLRVFLDGEDQTSQLDPQTLFQSLPATLEHEYTQLLTAATAVTVLNILTTKGPTIVHVPGPLGLSGGYPIIQEGHQGVAVKLPVGLALEDAIRINKEGQRLDGIEHIDEDGTVYFTENNMLILKRVMGYECRKMRLSEVESWAKDLKERYLRLVPNN